MFDAGDNSETGFLCCPKCLFDVIYDEKKNGRHPLFRVLSLEYFF